MLAEKEPDASTRNFYESPKEKTAQEIWFDELRYWPYTIHQIDDTLDSALIEGRAKQLLFQELNSRSVTAFIGSGISAAYGRMDWKQWQQKQLEHVEKLAVAFLILAKNCCAYMESLIVKDQNPPFGTEAERDVRLSQRWLRHRLQVIRRAEWDARNLMSTYQACVAKNGEFPGGEGAPVLFEIAQNLHDLIIRYHKIFVDEDDELTPRQDSASDFETKVVGLTQELLTNLPEASEPFPSKYIFGSAVRTRNGAPVERLPGMALWALDKGLLKTATHQACVDSLLDFEDLLENPTANLRFADLAKTMLIDECPHAKHLLEEGLSYAAKVGRPETVPEESKKAAKELLGDLIPSPEENLKRDLDGIRKNHKHYKVLGYFRLETLEDFIEEQITGNELPSVWRPIFEDIWINWEKYTREQESAPLEASRTFLTPTSRFLVPVLLSLLEDPFAEQGGKQKSVWNSIREPAPRDFVNRRSVIARHLDPLERINERLRIKRFLTTNYDFEIERYFEDQGYRRFDPHRAFEANKRAADDPRHFRTNGLGGSMRDQVFAARTATDLLAFTADGRRADVSIFHLHGRATNDDDIVVTERDYMNLYLRRDPDREVVDESILMAFAGNPILFLGLGMTETDVLRPLRQFMSDQDRLVGYRAIVLLPADKDFESRAKMSAGLYMRYGAYTIHFGGGNIKPAGADAKLQPVDWLHRVMQIISAIEDAAKQRLEEIGEFEDTEALSPLNEVLLSPLALSDKVGNLGRDLIGPEESPKDHPALPVMMGIDVQRWTAQLEAHAKGNEEEKDRAASELQELVRGKEIQDCVFTSHRHQYAERVDTDRAIETDSEPYAGFYTRHLTKLVHLALDEEPKYGSAAEARRSLNALRLALNGLRGAFLSACLNAALDGLHQEWQVWWKDWQAMPPNREARFQQLKNRQAPSRTHSYYEPAEETNRELFMFPRREVRHRVESIITDTQRLEHLTAPSFNLGALNHDEQTAFPASHLTGVRIFDRFIYDVARMENYRRSGNKRFFTTVDAPRGRGKGIFFSTLTTRLGLTSYIGAAHRNGSNATPPAFVSAIYINFSFSTEIASVFGMLVDTLRRTAWQLSCARRLHGPNFDYSTLEGFRELERILQADESSVEAWLACEGKPLTEEDGEFWVYAEEEQKKLDRELRGLSRFEQARYLLQHFKVLSDEFAAGGNGTSQIRPRILICLNAVELLFDHRKQPKNMEIADYLRLLSSNETKDVPIDVISVGDLGATGQIFGRDKFVPGVCFNWQEQTNAEREAILHQAASHKMACIDGGVSFEGIKAPPEELNFVHFAQPAKSRRFLVDNFPVLAMALYLARKKRESAPIEFENKSILTEVSNTAFRKLNKIRDAFWLESNPPDCNEKYLESRTEFNELILKSLYNGLAPDERQNFDGFSGFNRARHENLQAFAASLHHAFRPAKGTEDAEDWADLDTTLAGNRFCLTILLAAAEQLVLLSRDFCKGGEQANQMLEGVVATLRNASAGQREEMVMTSVMSVYRRISQTGDVDYDHDLHQLLLRNIAVLGCPVSPNILVRLPDIRDYFNEVQFDTDLSRRRMVARAIAALAERGLVFRISPHPKLLRLHDYVKGYDRHRKADDENIANDTGDLNIRQEANDRLKHFKDLSASFESWPAHHEYRYALHRQTQNYCFQRLGHLTAPPVTANSFAPTLYASMPSRVVRLSTEAYLFLRRLLLGLSQYPDIRHDDTARLVPTFGEDDAITRVQALRAGMSLARTCFSIAAVSRFDRDNKALSFIRKRGHFETYRVRLRWILRKAWEVHEPRAYLYFGSADTVDKRRLNALYFDEIVWLYNEVAVTCLVQGALKEAIGHARQALHLNRQVETQNAGGRMHNMLSLNIAIIQLERGRLHSAETRLHHIVSSETGHHRVYHLASGYLALIKQLRGRRYEAEKGMKLAIEELEKEKEDRALAIMLHHYARLISSEKPEKAERCMRRAHDYAERGGHEDVRHRILVSEVWISQTFALNPENRMRSDRLKLREVEQYAQTMGLHALLVESLHAQGMILLAAGDFSSSGRMITKAMAIARRNDMTLRLNAAMTNYAKVLLARRRVASARRLLNSALAMAKRCGYSSEVVRIHAVMADVDRQSPTEE